MNLLQIKHQIQSKIELAQKRGGFSHPVQLIAVTKTHPFTTIENCYKAGLHVIGENKIQEAVQKFESFNSMPKISKRFIGHLQSNKINKCIELFDAIDSVDSLKLARKISNSAKRVNKTIPVLLEINTSGESQKFGFRPDETDEIKYCFDLPNIKIDGLMTVGPLSKDKEKIRKSFRQLCELKDTLNFSINQSSMTELSMGMSGDYEIAVEEGATMIRLGSVLFGNRIYN